MQNNGKIILYGQLDLPKDLYSIYVKIGKIENEIDIKLTSYPFACKGGHKINRLGLSIFA